MSDLGFSWNTTPVKTIYLSPEGQKVQKDLPAAEIIAAPNRHQMESVMKALTIAVSELIGIQEQQATRILQLQKQLQEKQDA